MNRNDNVSVSPFNGHIILDKLKCFNLKNMKKSFLGWMIVSLLMGMNLCASAQENGSYYEAFLEINDNLQEYSLYQLRQAGALVTGRFNGFMTVRVNNGVDPFTLVDIEGVDYVTKALTLLTSIDTARVCSNVAPAHMGEGLDMPYTGSGVIVGLIDCGFDFNHINFFDSNGVSRVKAVYLPLDTTMTPPVVNMVRLPGSCYESPDQIATLTTDDNQSTHGTLTAGLAVGGYKDNGWYGMAPDADIVLCGMPEGELTDVRVANCISYICDYARRQMKPCVISMSLCSNVGPHDGTSYLNRVCQQLAGPGRVFVTSAGNDGAYNVTSHRTIENSRDTVFTLLNGFRASTQYSGYVNARSNAKKPFNTRLIVVNKSNGEILYRSRAIGATSRGVLATFSTETDTVLARYFTGSVEVIGSIEANGKPNSMCNIDMVANSRNYCLGFQYYSPSANDLVIFTSKYAYIDSYGFSWAEKGSSVGSISDLAATDSIISVGSYNSRQTVPLRDGSYYFRPNSTPGYLSSFSSYGPDENGISRPDVCAPGSVLVSSANRYFVDAPNLQYWQPSAFVDGVEYTYSPDLGTSMSAPIVAGAIALWMQAVPTLTVNDVREVLKRTALRDSYVRSGSRERWGAGKLDAYAGLLNVLKLDEIVGDVNNDREVNIADINVVISIILGEEVAPDVLRRADVNKDDEVNISDVNMIIGIILNS